MCNFFSFISDGSGSIFYAGSKLRQDTEWLEAYNPDSHTSLATYWTGKAQGDDLVNKYEWLKGEFIIDQINVEDDSLFCRKWIEGFVKTKEFQEICLVLVRKDGYALKYVKDQTPEICLAAVMQAGYALEYVKNQTEEICLAAVMQNGYALGYVKNQTEEIYLAAIQQNSSALYFVNPIIRKTIKNTKRRELK